jgi:hypothetical protein
MTSRSSVQLLRSFAPPHSGLSEVQREEPSAQLGEVPFYGKARDRTWARHLSSGDRG